MSSSRATITSLLEKTTHYDKDERYMATSDLCELLKRGMDDTAMEKEICKTILQLLHDASHDVQAVAVKTLGVLLQTVHTEQVLEICDSLTDQVLDSNKGKLRDVYTIGLRTTVKSCTTESLANRLLGPNRILTGITSEDEEIALACLDVLGDLLASAQSAPQNFPQEHSRNVMDLCLKELTNESSPVLRKRAGNALAGLSVLLDDALLQEMIEKLLSGNHIEARIRTLCAVSNAVGPRLVAANKMGDIIPLFLQYTSDIPTEDSADDSVSNELREACFLGMESFVRGPPSPEHQKAILESALRFLKYDPNYAYDDDDDNNDENMETNEEDGDDEMQEEEDEYDEYDEEDDEEEDDDDDSWKVRRSAIRVLKAIVDFERPSILWKAGLARSLIQRFKEREENCRVGILECFTALLTKTLSDDDPYNGAEYTNDIVKACQKILATKRGTNDRSKSKTLALMSILCRAPGGIGNQVASVLQHVQKLLADQEGTNKALRLDGLTLVVAVLSSGTHDASLIRSVLREFLLKQLCKSLREQWYKSIAEALRAFIYIPGYFTGEADAHGIVKQMYPPMQPLIAAHDVDQEIKECALKAMGALLVMKELDPDQSAWLLALLVERLKNETTRIAAIKTVSSVAKDCDLSPVLVDIIRTMASFMEYASRSLKQAALEALDVVIQKQGASVADDTLFSQFIVYVAPLLSDRDLHLCQLGLRAVSAVVALYPVLGSSAQTKLHAAILETLMEPSLKLTVSSQLQGQTLESLLVFFQQLVEKKVLTFQETFAKMEQRLDKETHKTGVYNLSKCISAITVSASEAQQAKTFEDVFGLLGGSPTPQEVFELLRVQLALLMTGDLGQSVDLSKIGDTVGKLKTIYEGYFTSSSEDLKSSVAYALGKASVGSPTSFLPMIVSRLSDANKRLQYLLLSALREFIQCNAKLGVDMTIHMEMVVPPLESLSSDKEEGVRSLVSECLGSLAVAHPAVILAKLAHLYTTHSIITLEGGSIPDGDASLRNAHICSTIATSVKHAISGKVDEGQLASFMPTFVELVQQEELRVRNAALLMLYSAFHHMPNVVTDLAKESIMPHLYKISELKAERKVDLGPFTHTEDDALPLRKSALSIFSTCLETNPGSIDMPSLMAVLARSLADKEDIQLHAHQIIISMINRHSYYLSASLDSFVEPLEKTMNKKPGSKTGTELERLNDWIKSSLRVMMALSAMDGAKSSTKFMDLVQRVKGNTKFALQLSALEEEN